MWPRPGQRHRARFTDTPFVLLNRGLASVNVATPLVNTIQGCASSLYGICGPPAGRTSNNVATHPCARQSFRAVRHQHSAQLCTTNVGNIVIMSPTYSPCPIAHPQLTTHFVLLSTTNVKITGKATMVARDRTLTKPMCAGRKVASRSFLTGSISDSATPHSTCPYPPSERNHNRSVSLQNAPFILRLLNPLGMRNLREQWSGLQRLSLSVVACNRGAQYLVEEYCAVVELCCSLLWGDRATLQSAGSC